LQKGVEECWDGKWFQRAFMDDGMVLGSSKSIECRIDLLTQSWSVLSGITSTKKARTAMKSAADMLVDYQSGAIKILDPPFANINAGYIADYPPFVRENGGQYTHAALWYIIALLQIGGDDFAYSLLEMLSPINKSLSLKGQELFMTEPYVLCGDVYTGDYKGTGGWSWYTGAAGWYYKCMIEEVIGIKISKNTISFAPHLPKKEKKLLVKIRHEDFSFQVEIENESEGKWCLFANKTKHYDCSILMTKKLSNQKLVLKKI
jgi:cyclic beta-1,2-glucan synthetase